MRSRATLGPFRGLRNGLSGAAVYGLLLALLPVHVVRGPVASAVTPPYNVVVILSDDQRLDTVTAEFMPKVWNDLVLGGTFFQNAFVPTPLCCPSRASILTGNHAHTTGVWTNRPADDGGFPAFEDDHTIAVDFDRAGYRTAMIGKYMNGYVAGRTMYVPPGWDRWFAVQTSAYYDYGVTTERGLLQMGNDPRDHATRVLGRKAKRFVTASVNDGQPFFLYVAFTAPHLPATPDPRDVTRFDGRTGSRGFDKQLESAYGLDRVVGRLVDVLPAHTIVVYLSDNGHLWGEEKGDRGPLHGKKWPYDESIRIPIVLRSLDGTYAPAAAPTDLVLNIDLRDTLTSAAGVAPTTINDGMTWGGPGYSARSMSVLEQRLSGAGQVVPSYCGVREAGWMYVRYQDGIEELYREPDERANLAGDPAHAAELARLKQAAQALCDPAPPGYTW